MKKIYSERERIENLKIIFVNWIRTRTMRGMRTKKSDVYMAMDDIPFGIAFKNKLYNAIINDENICVIFPEKKFDKEEIYMGQKQLTTIRLTQREKNFVEEIAHADECSMNWVIRQAVLEYAKNRGIDNTNMVVLDDESNDEIFIG